MKKIAICLMAACLSLTLLPVQLKAATSAPASSLTAPKSAESKEVRNLNLRLNEISSKDISTLKPSEKKSMRKEVRSINHKLREVGGGVYLSGGAIILIAILLIVLL
jgi:hypothetical protein